MNLQPLELLSPAGDLERLKFAVLFGADAVYVGGESFGMRSAPKNFTPQQLADGALFAHARGKKVYLTLNTVPRNDEIARLPDYLASVKDTGIDAFIVTDLGVLSLVKRYAPEIPVHMSTQTGIANYAAATAAYELGASRVVLARELTLREIAEIRDNTPPQLELEAFVHGAMCMSFSGRCLLSNYLAGRDANRGECTQPCRWPWRMEPSPAADEAPVRMARCFDVAEEEGGSYILNANDLCTAPFLDLIAAAGVTSFKIEGRAKTFYYVASVTSAYRRALDALRDDPEHFVCPEPVLEELTRTSHRSYSPGFYFGSEDAVQNTRRGGYIREWEVVGIVNEAENGVLYCEQRGKFTLGETLEALPPHGDAVAFTPGWIRNAEGEEIGSTPHAQMLFSVPCEHGLPPYTILRRRAVKT